MEHSVATVNFSIPDEVKEAFNATFGGQNKSAIVAALMREAIDRAQRRQASAEACERILARRQHKNTFTEAQIRAARETDRP